MLDITSFIIGHVSFGCLVIWDSSSEVIFLFVNVKSETQDSDV